MPSPLNFQELSTGDNMEEYKSFTLWGMEVKVDAEDFERVMEHDWNLSYITGYYYVSTRIKNKTIYLSRYLMGVINNGKNTVVDHINHDTLDNRKANLRVCDRWENLRNCGPDNKETKTSQYKGVSWDKFNRRWRAQLFHKRPVSLGRFIYEKDAAVAYDKAAKKHFGEFAYLNFN